MKQPAAKVKESKETKEHRIGNDKAAKELAVSFIRYERLNEGQKNQR